MGSTFHSLHFHAVFSTKERRPIIRDAWRGSLHEYLGGTIRGLGAVPQAVGGVADHVHLLIGLPTSIAPSDLLREIKKATSNWASAHHDKAFGWQEGYAIFTVSATHRDAVKRYIARQEEHHRQYSFLDELRKLLERNKVDFDEKYLI